MKSLTKHIEEKLIINKNLKNYRGNTPDKKGKFLKLYTNSCENGKNNRIDISVEEYTFKDNIFKDSDGPYKKNEKGYYWTDDRFSGYWLVLALIGDDALDFLNILLNDPNSKFNLFEYFDESQQELIDDITKNVYHPQEINGYTLNVIDKDQINDLINEINEDIN